MSEPATPETAAERITREIAEALDRLFDEAADEAAAAARFAADTSALIALIARIRAQGEKQDA